MYARVSHTNAYCVSLFCAVAFGRHSVDVDGSSCALVGGEIIYYTFIMCLYAAFDLALYTQRIVKFGREGLRL